MRGRKPKPSYLRVLDGNAGHRPANPDEPVPVGNLEEQAPPEWMSETQKTGWRYAMKHAPPGLLKKLDRAVLTVWVVAESIHADAAQQVERLGSLLKGQSGIPYQNPYLAIMNKQAVIMMKACAEMGFTPSSRSRVKVEKPPPGTGDTFADLKRITD
jgi:P27 family predicted phage terminase small subunit